MKIKLSILLFLLITLCSYSKAQSKLISYYDSEKELYGFKDSITARVITEPVYAYIGDFVNGMAVVNVGGYYDYEDDYADEETLFDGKWGAVDRTGKVIIPVKYDRISDFSKEGLAIIEIDSKFGFINKTGVEIVPPKYSEITDDYIAYRFTLEGKTGYFDRKGKEIIPAIYRDIILNYDVLKALVQTTDFLYGLYDIKNKKFLIEPQFLEVTKLAEEKYFIAAKSESYAVYDFAGRCIIPANKYDVILNINGILLSVKKDSTAGVCNIVEEFLIPFGLYSNIIPTNCFITKLIPEYDDPQAVMLDYFQIEKDHKWGCIDLNGKTLIPTEYHEEIAYGDTILGIKGSKWLCMDIDLQPFISLDTAYYKNCELTLGYDNEQLMTVIAFQVNGNEYKMDMQRKILADNDKYLEDLAKVGYPVKKTPVRH